MIYTPTAPELHNFWKNILKNPSIIHIEKIQNYMVSSPYSDSQNVDLWTNLTKSGFFFYPWVLFSTGAL